MNQDWTIQKRTDACAATGRAFVADELFYTLLFEEAGGYRREDLSEEAFHARGAAAPPPFSFWRSKYTPPPPPAPEPLGKQTAEDLLRTYMAEQTPQHAHARYLLAVMLERKRLLREIEVRRGGESGPVRVYEHTKTGEVFIIPDPGLRLDQLAAVQQEVSALLGP
jgi:hypothetical protein